MVLIRQKTPPAQEPVTVAEAKAHLRLEHNLDDAYVGTLITVARQHIENVCWRGIVTQTWEVTLDSFPRAGLIELPKGTLKSITSVKYLDSLGVLQTMDPASYAADMLSVPGTVRLGYDLSWPSSRYTWNSIVVEYVVGWDVADVPKPLVQAILLLVSQMYEQRTPDVTGTIVSPINFSVDALVAPYRLRRF